MAEIQLDLGASLCMNIVILMSAGHPGQTCILLLSLSLNYNVSTSLLFQIKLELYHLGTNLNQYEVKIPLIQNKNGYGSLITSLAACNREGLLSHNTEVIYRDEILK